MDLNKKMDFSSQIWTIGGKRHGYGFSYDSRDMLSNVIYNDIGLVDSICFSNGNNVKYVYDMAGNKLRTTHYTAQLVPVQTPLDLTTSAGQASSTTGTTTSTTGSASSTTTPATRVTRILVKSAETLYMGADIQINSMTGKYTYLFGGGYAEFNPTATTDTIRYYYYTKDHLGNIRNVLAKNDSGDMEEIQRTSYYPFGGIIATDSLSFGRDIQNHTYNGKEQDFANNLFWLDYGARQYDPTRGQFTTPDPLAEKYYSTNYFTYCMNNPMKFIDPDGRSTYVADNGNGTYCVVGGKLDKNRNIYLCTLDKNGNISKIGKSIGKSLTTISFYDSDSQKWAIGSIINPSDKSGQNFLNKMKSVGLGDYISNAKGKEPYDFKTTNGTDKFISKDPKYVYRGMRISSKTEGVVYASARDVGNYAAGMVAALHGTTWQEARTAFDALESYQKDYVTVEGMSTQLAESKGFYDYNCSMMTVTKHLLFILNPITTIINTCLFPF